MYAIVRIGGKQYRAEVGKTIVVEKLPHQIGDKVDFAEVLMVSDGENTQIGQPLVSGAAIKAEVVDQFKGKKVVVFKYKPKIRYRRKQGHRQYYTRLQVSNIVGGGAVTEKKTRSTKKKAAPETTEE
jgi:large subunit ribosomal protein L21